MFLVVADHFVDHEADERLAELGVELGVDCQGAQALDLVGAQLLADPAPGDKYILFVTDGQPDYCDDSQPHCSIDSVVGGLQGLKAKGIHTIVMGLQSATSPLYQKALNSFATAGAGEPTVAALDTAQTVEGIYDYCSGTAGWVADMTSAGRTLARGSSVGTYASTAGATKPYQPNAADQNAIVSQLSAALSGVKGCAFGLLNGTGEKLEVDLAQIDSARVRLDGLAIAYDASNGWSMASSNELRLNGAACDAWRKPAASDLRIEFACDSLSPQ